MALIITGTVSFVGGLIANVLGEILDYGLLTEGLTEGSEDYDLITQAVTSTNDFGSITEEA